MRASTLIAALAPLLAATLSLPTNAQRTFDDGHHSQQEPYISIFEHCGFRGERRDIAVGQFKSMRELDFGNDELSSIKVPRELKAVIYEHDDFKGTFAKVSRDVRCFDKNWNDQVSSLKVEYSDTYKPSKHGKVYGGGNSGGHYNESSQRPNKRIFYEDGVTGYNLTQVVFNNRVLQKIDDRTWEIKGQGQGAGVYEQVRVEENAISLKNKYSPQRIRVDLAANELSFIGHANRAQRFQIKSRSAQQDIGNKAQYKEPSRRFKDRCLDYYVYTDGKSGSMRFSNGKDLYRFQEKGHKGRTCHKGELTIELGKRDFNTDLTLEIQGRVFKFASGEKETQYRANWYRKVIKLQVGY